MLRLAFNEVMCREKLLFLNPFFVDIKLLEEDERGITKGMVKLASAKMTTDNVDCYPMSFRFQSCYDSQEKHQICDKNPKLFFIERC